MRRLVGAQHPQRDILAAVVARSILRDERLCVRQSAGALESHRSSDAGTPARER